MLEAINTSGQCSVKALFGKIHKSFYHKQKNTHIGYYENTVIRSVSHNFLFLVFLLLLFTPPPPIFWLLRIYEFLSWSELFLHKSSVWRRELTASYLKCIKTNQKKTKGSLLQIWKMLQERTTSTLVLLPQMPLSEFMFQANDWSSARQFARLWCKYPEECL